MIYKDEYEIIRPPIHLTSFAMPTKEEIEEIIIGSIVKVIITQVNKIPERIWCKIIDSTEDGWIKAKLCNTPINLTLPETIKFHVTDIIAIWDE